MTYCFRISEDLHRFATFAPKLFIVFAIISEQFCYRSNNKTILWANAANFLQICVNLQKSWNNSMSNDGLIVENMDLSHIHLAEQGLLEEKVFLLFLPKSEGKIYPLPPCSSGGPELAVTPATCCQGWKVKRVRVDRYIRSLVVYFT